jgi:peptidyl-tRNA hydrolase, PTH1 family
MRAIVGLGNPGSRYATTRHNVGFDVVAELARRWRLSLQPTRCDNRVAQGAIDGEQILLVEPQLYMNLSGAALSRLRPPLTAGELIVAHDELDLGCGRVRIKRGGGAGGHRGIASIIEHYGAEFVRVRVGVGRPSVGEDPAEYVLSPFADGERETIDAAVARAADAVDCILRHGLEVAMNRFNARDNSAPPVVAAPLGRN